MQHSTHSLSDTLGALPDKRGASAKVSSVPINVTDMKPWMCVGCIHCNKSQLHAFPKSHGCVQSKWAQLPSRSSHWRCRALPKRILMPDCMTYIPGGKNDHVCMQHYVCSSACPYVGIKWCMWASKAWALLYNSVLAKTPSVVLLV